MRSRADMTQDDYDGIVHYLEDELDYQYSLLGAHRANALTL